MKHKETLIFLCIMFICMIFAFEQGRNVTEKEIIRDTTTNIVRDTLWHDTVIYEKQFVPKYITKVKTDTVYKNGDTIQLVTESKVFEKRLVSGKDTADLSIYTTGIETSLDSLKMALKTHTEVVTNTVVVTRYIERQKTLSDRFHFGLQGGAGYGFIQKKPDIYIGVGGQFQF